VALVDDDEVEEVGGIVAEVGRGLAVFGRPAHEGLEDGEEQTGVLRNLRISSGVTRANASSLNALNDVKSLIA
jgi:hypothetical protein